jgi:5'-phosphate synthase pdxT subunit
MVVGLLAIQGDVIEHIRILKKIGVKTKEVRLPEDLDGVSGLIIPGGESTTIMKLLNRFGLDKKIISLYKQKRLALFGTCAGLIVLAKEIKNYPKQNTLGLLDVVVDRNGYGRQLESFEQEIEILGKKINGVFIRAPVIEKTGKGVEVLSSIASPVLIRKQRILGATFHPELSTTFVHKLFLKMCKKNVNNC